MIWLEDRGPIFFSQKRSGWLGRPQRSEASHHDSTASRCSGGMDQVGDQRIVVGGLLRRLQYELPQLQCLER